jgi:hypothetical protein
MATILATGYQRAGKGSSVIVGTTPLVFASYSSVAKGDDLGTENFDDFDGVNSYSEGMLGFLHCDWTCGGDWDMHRNPIDLSAGPNTIPAMYPRDDLPGLRFVLSNGSNNLENLNESSCNWSFAYARVRSSTNGSDVKGKVTFTGSGMNQGKFLFPSGSFT